MKKLRLALAALVVAGAALAVAPASPAAASPSIECYTIVDDYGQVHYHCYVVGALEEICFCKTCPWIVDIREQIVLPEFDEQILTAVDLLSQAAYAADPRTGAALHDRAVAQFTAAAQSLKGTPVTAGFVGYHDITTGKDVATRTAWLAAASQDLADGVTLLEKSFGSGDSAALVRAATAQFDEAFQEINQKAAIGG
ncbi:hypothetical protein [Hamadaea tsunoensis]|uniref:hypothetical protein n=1 Tax=Hamadaea tsunoensis TaxID=53368 RepID=UPI000420E1E5|nr:hypothetical protein [Hamadaea tsunoensis]